MSHWLVVPIVLPALVAALLIVLRDRLAWQRLASGLAVAALLATAIGLALRAAEADYTIYALGAWPPPFGIVLVLDRLAALMLLVTAVVAGASFVFALDGVDARGRYFHALFQFQLMGLNGAFLTGDLFNLFVFFEVLLIASYGLLLHGGGAKRLRAGVHYVVINLAGSALFLFGVGLLYGMTGTLNMADMAVKIAAASAADAALIAAGGLILLVVFGVKAALVPLHFWLPTTYAAAAAPVAALFAIMTKLGVYAIVRLTTLLFGSTAGASGDWAQIVLLPAGLATLALATIGALGARTLKGMIGYLTIASVGTLVAGLGLFDQNALAASLYYLVHSTLAIALVFLLAELIARQRGTVGDRLHRAPAVTQPMLLGALFLFGAVGLAGVPPLSGFLGKLVLLQAAYQTPAATGLWAVLLSSAFFTIVTLARAGSAVFWNTSPADVLTRADLLPGRVSPAEAAPVAILVACITGLTVAAGPTLRYTAAASAQLLQPASYVDHVLATRRTPASPGRR